MTKSLLLQKFKWVWLSFLKRSLDSDEMRNWINFSFPNTLSSRYVDNLSNPYVEGLEVDDLLAKKPIIITGRFRSGSTLLWNIFRKMDGFTAYYEPFNERRWFDRELRGEGTDESHRGVTNYSYEYDGLDLLKKYYDEDWVRYNLFMDKTDFNLEMMRYIKILMEHAQGRPVLQFNRVDFRLGWLRQQFPSATLLHIYRNPRNQWYSTLRSDSGYTKDSRGAVGFRDRFYLDLWVKDLCRQFPFLSDYEHEHRYYHFYFLWKLSYCYGQQFSDCSISMEKLTNEPRILIDQILSNTGSKPLSPNFDLSFIESTASLWHKYADDRWFRRIEQHCESVLNEFLLGKNSNEKNSFNQ